MSEVELNSMDALRQAEITADHYLRKSHDILKEYYEDSSIGDAIELAKVMAQDFHTCMMCLKMQEIRDAIRESKFE